MAGSQVGLCVAEWHGWIRGRDTHLKRLRPTPRRLLRRISRDGLYSACMDCVDVHGHVRYVRYVHVHVRVYVYVYVCVCMCMCIHFGVDVHTCVYSWHVLHMGVITMRL